MTVFIEKNALLVGMETAFTCIFNDRPVLRVLDFLVVNEDFDYSVTDIANLSGVGYSTLKIFWGNLEKRGIVANTRAVGKSKMYKLDLSSPIVKKFREFYWETTKQAVHAGVEESVMERSKK